MTSKLVAKTPDKKKSQTIFLCFALLLLSLLISRETHWNNIMKSELCCKVAATT